MCTAPLRLFTTSHTSADAYPAEDNKSTRAASSTSRPAQRARVSCPVCRQQVVRRVLRRHIETLHCVQKPVPCSLCPKVFKHRYSLDCHLRQAHPERRKEGRAAARASRNNNDLVEVEPKDDTIT